MTLELFMKTNDLKEIEFKKIEYKDNSIYAYISYDIEIEYMANGCRPEFNKTVNHLYIFKNQDRCNEYKESQYVKEYNYDGKVLELFLTMGKIKIKDCDIEIKQNI